MEKELFEKYKGMYVVLVNDRIVSSGKNAKKVLEEARSKYPKAELILKKVPEEELLTYLKLLEAEDAKNLFEF